MICSLMNIDNLEVGKVFKDIIDNTITHIVNSPIITHKILI